MAVESCSCKKSRAVNSNVKLENAPHGPVQNNTNKRQSYHATRHHGKFLLHRICIKMKKNMHRHQKTQIILLIKLDDTAISLTNVRTCARTHYAGIRVRAMNSTFDIDICDTGLSFFQNVLTSPSEQRVGKARFPAQCDFNIFIKHTTELWFSKFQLKKKMCADERTTVLRVTFLFGSNRRTHAGPQLGGRRASLPSKLAILHPNAALQRGHCLRMCCSNRRRFELSPNCTLSRAV